MVKFDSNVQLLKFKILKEIASLAYSGKLYDEVENIPDKVFPIEGNLNVASIYKSREVARERVHIALGGDIYNKNVVEVIRMACDECPLGGYEVTNACRGCIAHRCQENCNFGAISFDKFQHAFIDMEKCKSCGACSKACPYGAIRQNIRPCINACKVKAMEFHEDKSARINNEKCINCGSCVYQCPFGAVVDKSYITNVIDYIVHSENNTKYKVYAIVAPAIAAQFDGVKLSQVITGIKRLGFHTVIETALGADMVAEKETMELVERGFITSSCCPAFVKFIKSNYKDIEKDISSNLSPMGELASFIKRNDETSKVVFIGPCIAKKAEVKDTEAGKYVDAAITFEELEAMFEAKEINLSTLTESVLDDASYFGRIFARSGGLTDAVKEGLIETDNQNFVLKAEVCDGIEKCNLALLKKSKGLSDVNFIEGMACINGCIGGPGCISHEPRDKSQIDSYGKEAFEKKILDSTRTTKVF